MTCPDIASTEKSLSLRNISAELGFQGTYPARSCAGPAANFANGKFPAGALECHLRFFAVRKIRGGEAEMAPLQIRGLPISWSPGPTSMVGARR